HGGKVPFDYVYVCPSPSVYPHQWLWDSCFHAIVMARFDGRLAESELATIISRIRPDGFIPHLINWNASAHWPLIDRISGYIRDRMHHANLTQPPVLGIAMEEVYRHTGNRDFLERYLPSAKLHYNYLAAHRDPDGDGLVSIIFPIESGMDHSPIYDIVLGLEKASAIGFHVANVRLALRYLLAGWNLKNIFSSDACSVEDVAFNCIYASGLRAMARLCHAVGDADAGSFSKMASHVEQAIIHLCYNHDDDIFYSLYSKNDKQAQVKTVASLMPLILEGLPSSMAQRLVNNYLLKPDYFWTRHPVPSVSISEEKFNPCSSALNEPAGLLCKLGHALSKYQMVWRGPTWINTNWFIAGGLRRHQYDEVADELTAKTAQMVAKAGFWEFYNPLTGEGLGAADFGWSTLVVDMLDKCSPGVRASILNKLAA
ncbi:MAG: hypothetical protein M1358_09560, partial [Chloroflexi bacterium]|nr:hypothetical protein [Chloroflexota bacterium]